MSDQFLAKFWKSCVKDEFDVVKSFQAQAAGSHAIAVKDRGGGWIVEKIEAQLAARMWIYTRWLFAMDDVMKNF